MSYDPDVDVPKEVKQFIIAIRRKAMNDMTYAAASQKSVGMLAGTITKCLTVKTREVRIAVLEAITGIPVASGSQLTQFYVSTIIDEVLNDRHNCVAFIEGFFEKSIGRKPYQLFPWERPKVNLPPVFEADLDWHWD